MAEEVHIERTVRARPDRLDFGLDLLRTERRAGQRSETPGLGHGDGDRAVGRAGHRGLHDRHVDAEKVGQPVLHCSHSTACAERRSTSVHCRRTGSWARLPTVTSTKPVSRQLAHLRAPDVVTQLSERSIVVQPLGAIEQHGPHLPLHTDLLIAESVAVAAVARSVTNSTCGCYRRSPTRSPTSTRGHRARSGCRRRRCSRCSTTSAVASR